MTSAIQALATSEESRALRDTLSRYATGVAVVTTVDVEGRPVGLTVNSFTSVSLDPPLVLWCLRRDSASCAAFTSAGRYAVNVLRASQQDLARRFAAAHVDRFADVAWRFGAAGLPVLGGTIAQLVCTTYQQHIAGDHIVLVGQVVAHEATSGPPLVFHHHRYLTGYLAADAREAG